MTHFVTYLKFRYHSPKKYFPLFSITTKKTLLLFGVMLIHHRNQHLNNFWCLFLFATLIPKLKISHCRCSYGRSDLKNYIKLLKNICAGEQTLHSAKTDLHGRYFISNLAPNFRSPSNRNMYDVCF